MQDAHRQAAQLHELAARSHRTSVDYLKKGDHVSANWHSERALEYAERAFLLAKQVHIRSGHFASV